MGRNRFVDKVVVITGASSGIGYVTARMFATEGAEVVIINRNEEAGMKAQSEIANSLFIKTDITRAAEV